MDDENKRCYICKKYFKIENIYIKNGVRRRTRYICKRCNYFSTYNRSYAFKSWYEFEKWYMKQWNYQLGYDPLGIPLPNPNPCPEWEGAAQVDHDHLNPTEVPRGLTSVLFNTNIKLFEGKSKKECIELSDIIFQWMNRTWKQDPKKHKKYLQQQKRQKELEEQIKTEERYKKEKNPKHLFYWF